MEMSERQSLLKSLKVASRQYAESIELRDLASKRWSTWNAWASKQDWYHSWAYKNCLFPSDLIGCEDKGVEVVKSEDEGTAYWANRSLTFKEMVACREYFVDVLLERAWKSEVPLKVIATACERSQPATYKFISRAGWFTKRHTGQPAK